MPECQGFYQTAWLRLKWWSEEDNWEQDSRSGFRNMLPQSQGSMRSSLQSNSRLLDSKGVTNQQGTTAIGDAKEQKFMLRSAQNHIRFAWLWIREMNMILKINGSLAAHESTPSEEDGEKADPDELLADDACDDDNLGELSES